MHSFEAPCSKDMVDGGKISKEDLKAAPGTEGTTTVTLKKTPKETPEWKSLSVQTTDAKSVEVTPVNEKGEPSGPAKTQDVTDDKKPTEILFVPSVTASGFTVKAVPATPESKPTVEVVSAAACVETQGIFYFYCVMFD